MLRNAAEIHHPPMLAMCLSGRLPCRRSRYCNWRSMRKTGDALLFPPLWFCTWGFPCRLHSTETNHWDKSLGGGCFERRPAPNETVGSCLLREPAHERSTCDCLLSYWLFYTRYNESGGVLNIKHGRSRRTINPRIPTLPGRSTSDFHRPGTQ